MYNIIQVGLLDPEQVRADSVALPRQYQAGERREHNREHLSWLDLQFGFPTPPIFISGTSHILTHVEVVHVTFCNLFIS